MAKGENLVKVSFWMGQELKKEIDDFAHGLNLSSADFYKAGALLLKNSIQRPPEIVMNLFTRSFKDLEKSEVQKKILKGYSNSRSIY